MPDTLPPSYSTVTKPAHTNAVIKAGNIRAHDEQQMQNLLLNTQLNSGIYNTDIEPEHEVDGFYCDCVIHNYIRAKIRRLPVQEMWNRAVIFPGEKTYHDCYQSAPMFSGNPYNWIGSPYAVGTTTFYSIQRPDATCYTLFLQRTLALNSKLNTSAQAAIDAKEPAGLWEEEPTTADKKVDAKSSSLQESEASSSVPNAKSSRFSGLKKTFSFMSSEARAASKAAKVAAQRTELRAAILMEESSRWPNEEWRQIVAVYQAKVGMTQMISKLRTNKPIQYLHLLRAGYFEPIPVAWADSLSNPLKFTIDSGAGWRGITPAWRGFEDTAEERLYWVLNHRQGPSGQRMKPDIISAMQMALSRMASAVEPPPAYFSPDDTCHLQHKSDGYSRQVMPSPFRPVDGPESPADDTMILLDVSGSMDFEPVRPIYHQYLITGYSKSTQPKNKDVSKAIIRRFTDAMINHDHNSNGYQLVTFSDRAEYIGFVNHANFENIWRTVQFGGRTRVMTGWQQIKNLHFQKHSESATYHPVYGWQAGPKTPILRLLLLLDGEASDMDEFELDLLSLSWVHVTIFLIGVDGCPHHHRHANELQRISEVNHHVSFVDAQGNTPERFVTHELLKRHLGYDVSMSEFELMEELPAYE